MTSITLIEPTKGTAECQPPHLSYSRISRYLTCPEQYRFYYVEGYRPRFTAASLIFGQIIHQALSSFFQGQGDPVGFFTGNWREIQNLELRYAYRETWDKLMERGQALLELFLKEEVAKLERIVASEKAFALSITSLETPLVGVIDLLKEIAGRLTVVDFKTAAAAYEDHVVILSDQLTTYHLAEPEVRQSALCVFVKTKEPRIIWYFSERSGEQLSELLAKAERVGQDIVAGRFYKRPGQWCNYCDFLPLCLKDRQRAQETLVQGT